MKRGIAGFFGALLLGIAIGWFGSRFAHSGLGPSPDDDLCERQIDIALGHAIIESVPLLFHALEMASTDRVEDAQMLLRNHAWWQLEQAWVINQQYGGAIEMELNPLIGSIYPRLRSEIDFETFSDFPTDYLIEMSNFMEAADATVADQEQ